VDIRSFGDFLKPIVEACQRNCTYKPALYHYRRHPFGMF
jgi:hypothetical protein